MDTLTRLSESVISGNEAQASALTKLALDAGLSAKQILDDGLIGGMTVVGRRFKAHEIFLPEVLLAAKAMNAGMSVLKPVLVRQDVALARDDHPGPPAGGPEGCAAPVLDGDGGGADLRHDAHELPLELERLGHGLLLLLREAPGRGGGLLGRGRRPGRRQQKEEGEEAGHVSHEEMIAPSAGTIPFP